MKLRQAGSQPSARAPAEYFTGTVRIDPLFQAVEPSRVSGALVTFEPGEKHWHGASPETAMSHIAIQEARNGSPLEWMEKVTDEQYGDPASKGEPR